jgi:hypothetical protein
LAAKRKINPCFSGSRERHGESQPIVLGPFIRELIPFGNTHDPTSQVFLNLGLEDRSKYLREGGRAKHAPSGNGFGYGTVSNADLFSEWQWIMTRSQIPTYLF